MNSQIPLILVAVVTWQNSALFKMHNKSMISVVLCLITSDGDLVVLLVCVYLVFCIAFSCVALIDVLISHLGQKNDSETCVCVCVELREVREITPVKHEYKRECFCVVGGAIQ